MLLNSTEISAFAWLIVAVIGITILLFCFLWAWIGNLRRTKGDLRKDQAGGKLSPGRSFLPDPYENQKKVFPRPHGRKALRLADRNPRPVHRRRHTSHLISF